MHFLAVLHYYPHLLLNQEKKENTNSSVLCPFIGFSFFKFVFLIVGSDFQNKEEKSSTTVAKKKQNIVIAYMEIILSWGIPD